MCPVADVPGAEQLPPTGSPLHTPGLEACLIQLVQELKAQTAAITRLARSNEALVQAMAEAEGMDEGAMPRVDMSGKPIR